MADTYQVGGGTTIPDNDVSNAEPIKGPLMGAIWFCFLFILLGIILGITDYDMLMIFLGWRSMIGLAGYLIMQIGLWYTENKWDEEGSAAYLKAAGKETGLTPEAYEAMDIGADVKIPDDELKAAFPVPWGFLIGWWVWGLSYLFPMDGSFDVDPSAFGIIALIVSFGVSIIASIPMSDAVMNRLPQKKMYLSVAFLLGWITLGIMSALDASHYYGNMGDYFKKYDGENLTEYNKMAAWFLCLLGPITIIMSQKILFSSRKMGTTWETTASPNFHPIVYNMGGPLFVLGWFLLWLGCNGVPRSFTAGLSWDSPSVTNPPDIYAQSDDQNAFIPLFLNWRTWLSFAGGCAMVPVVRFLDFSHDEDGPWCNEGNSNVFGKFWLGTDGTYFGLFLESPWPFIIAWSCFGFSSFLGWDDDFEVGAREIITFIICMLQGVDAGILIQQNLYAGNAAGKKMWSLPFVLLFIALAINTGTRWGWRGIFFAVPGAILIILGQKTVFGARKRGDYTMQNEGKANPYENVFVYSWGEVLFMMGWILICWGMSFPTNPNK